MGFSSLLSILVQSFGLDSQIKGEMIYCPVYVKLDLNTLRMKTLWVEWHNNNIGILDLDTGHYWNNLKLSFQT